MRFIAVGAEAEGFIAIGQFATGVIAIGQVATGVFALGQIARGVVAVGMVSFGLVSFGMVSCGVVYAAGMLGAGGRGFGLIVPLVPVPSATPKLPERTTLDAIRASGRGGWIDATLRLAASGMPDLVYRGSALPVTLAASLLGPATAHAQLGSDVVARVVPSRDALRVEELKVVPRGGYGWIVGALQLALLGVVAYAYWALVLVDVGDVVIGTARALVSGAVE